MNNRQLAKDKTKQKIYINRLEKIIVKNLIKSSLKQQQQQ